MEMPMRGEKSKLGFGKRGREKAEPTERRPTALERLKKAGSRWWGVSGLQMAKDARIKGFKRGRLRP